MELVGQAIENRDTCVFSQLFHHRLVEPAVLDAVIHTPQDAGRVLHGLLVANVRSAGPQVGHVSTLVVSRHLEGTTGTSRRLLENEGNVLPLEERLLRPAVLGFFEICSQADKELDFLSTMMRQRQQMTILQIKSHDLIFLP